MMSSKESSLLERWRKIEESDNEQNAASDARYRRMKEEWFVDAFAYLNSLPKESHCWCQHMDVTLPLLEPFYNYFKAPDNSPIKTLWKRLSSELRICVTCILQYYKVKEYYKAEFVESVVNPILAVLQALDKKRVTSTMQDILQKQSNDNSQEVLCVVYEIFTYSELLEDPHMNDILAPFLRHVSNTHDLQLSHGQRYPGLCALLFHCNQDIRRITLGLVKTLEPFSDAEELESVQPVIEKRMKYLESSLTSLDNNIVGMTQESLWLGLKTILGLLKAPAIEEGIVERYPAFVSIVLNHVSEASTVFWNALCCLDLLLASLGFKLWLKSAFSPGVLRNTLLSQCFHAKDNKIHKAVFDLFQHFLQSLEAMQDGQYERQRRYLLYFLLQQVPHSNNFSPFIRKHALQVAWGIVAQSYKMDPPSPPAECAHFWGPALLSTVKDTESHSTLRQASVDLTGMVLVADATALSAAYIKDQRVKAPASDEGDEECSPASTSWLSFIQRVEAESENWNSIPLIWIESLENTPATILSSSFTLAFIWGASRISVLEQESQTQTHSRTIAAALNWEQPKGCDDGANGEGTRNAMKAASAFRELISIYKRSAESFALKIREHGRFADWSWESPIAEAILLLLMDSSSVLRKLAKDVLQQFSKECRLDSGLQFLCGSQGSLAFVLRGFAHAIKLLGDKPFEHCGSLQHLFFFAYRFLNIGQTWMPHGKDFLQKLSRLLWPLLVNGIIHGQHCSTSPGYETTCIRMFELLPILFKYMIPSAGNDTKQFELWKVDSGADCPEWFQELVGWSNISVVVSIRRRWHEATVSVLEDLARGAISTQVRCSKTVENVLESGSVLDNDERERLLLLFSSSPSAEILSERPKPYNAIGSDDELDLTKEQKDSGGDQKGIGAMQEELEPLNNLRHLSVNDAARLTSLYHRSLDNKNISASQPAPLPSQSKGARDRAEEAAKQHKEETRATNVEIDRRSQHTRPVSLRTGFQKKGSSRHSEKNLSRIGSLRKEHQSAVQDLFECVAKLQTKERFQEDTAGLAVGRDVAKAQENERTPQTREPEQLQEAQTKEPVDLANLADSKEIVLNDLVSEDGMDSLDAALDNAKKQRLPLATTSIHPKRKLVRLDMPGDQLKASLPTRTKPQQRLPPPKVDDWLMRILSFDMFNDADACSDELVKVPMSFKSAEHYMEVFRPLLIEEFKSQIQRSREELDIEDKERMGVVNLMSLERVDDLHLGRFLSEPGKDGASRACLENDLLLLSKYPYQEGSRGCHFLAKVERREKESKGGGTIVLVKLYLSPNIGRLTKAKRLLVNRSKWHMTRLMSITPQLREFQAVSAMSSSPLLEVILCPGPRSFPGRSSNATVPEGLWKKLRQDYNDSQLAAVKASLGNRGAPNHQISLVQGPPGTGKTRTIVAIASALLQLDKSEYRSDDNDRTSIGGGKVSYETAVARSWQVMALAKQIERDQSTRKNRKGRLLVCAQSNAAVDELVVRLCRNGLYNSSGQFYKPTIVRAGNANSIHPDTLPYFIDKLVEKRLCDEKRNVAGDEIENTPEILHSKLEQITEKINELSRKIAEDEDNEDSGLKLRLAKLEKERKLLTMEVNKSQHQFRKTIEADKIRKKAIRKDIIREADIVLTTLSGCGGDIYAACMESPDKTDVFFDAVIIDEAGQALEPATLIPLQLLATVQGRCVMVGDPKQLPATVLSQVANKLSFERSMFERFQTNGYPVTMLTIQYRMHPEIRKFPSFYFYDDHLVDGSSVLGEGRFASFHRDRVFRPYAFLDVTQGREKSGGSLQSIANTYEVDVVVELFKRFKIRYPQEFQPGRIGIITPYKRQLNLLKDAFAKTFGPKVFSSIEFNTIDGFQGREVDILILSTVRAASALPSDSRGIGFVADIRRMNVALTRARYSLWIVGNAKALATNRAWASLLEDATSRGVIHSVQQPYNKFFNTAAPSDIVTTQAERNRSIKEDRKRAAEPVQDTNKRQKLEAKPDRLPQGRHCSSEKNVGGDAGMAAYARRISSQNEAVRRGIKLLDKDNHGPRKQVPDNTRPGDHASEVKIVGDISASNRKVGEAKILEQDSRKAETTGATSRGSRGMDMNERRKQREEVNALLTGSLLSKKPDLSSRHQRQQQQQSRKAPQR